MICQNTKELKDITNSRIINIARRHYKENDNNSNEIISKLVNVNKEDVYLLLTKNNLNLVKSYTEPYTFFLYSGDREIKFLTEKDCNTVLNAIDFNWVEKNYLRTFGFIVDKIYNKENHGKHFKYRNK